MAEAKLGLTFGRVAETYDRLRPEFAGAAVDYAVASLGLAPGTFVLDLAAGTGTLTRALRSRFETVVAVEPDDEMRRYVGGEARAGYAPLSSRPARVSFRVQCGTLARAKLFAYERISDA